MQIKRVYNNNVALATDELGAEHVVVGRGVCFGRRPGETIDPARVEKVFSLREENRDRLEKLVQQIPAEYLLVAEEVVEMLHAESDLVLDDGLVLALADHISLAVERERRGVTLANPMLFEISHLYRAEYALAERAAGVIEERLGVAVGEEEVGFITLHIVNATMSEREDRLILSVALIKEILEVVDRTFDGRLDTESLAYERFLRHLQFFAQRVLDEGNASDGTALPVLLARDDYPEAFACAEDIAAYVERAYKVTVTPAERSYLVYHLATLAASARPVEESTPAGDAGGAGAAPDAAASDPGAAPDARPPAEGPGA